jgi:hypothetical protein
MITFERRFLIPLCIMFYLFGCSPNLRLPEHPLRALDMPKIYHASYENVWNAIIKVVDSSHGTIVVNDKKSGLIVYSIPDKESTHNIFVNVFVEYSDRNKFTLVYANLRLINDFFIDDTEVDFFNQLNRNMMEDG